MTKWILYGVGLFVVFLILLGLLLNYLLPLFGVGRPLTSLPILVSFWVCVLMVIILNRKRIYLWIKSFKKLSIPLAVYALILLPIMAIGGAELVNYTSNNTVLMIMLPLIVVVPAVCMFIKLIPTKYWAFAIWMMSLSVILHRCLISPYLLGSDSVVELMYSRNVYNNGVWAYADNIYAIYNTMPGITILPVMISKITFISLLWVFKLVLPILLSLLPVAVYEWLKTLFSERIAFLSSYFVMSVYTFFTLMLCTNKQMLATVFLVIFMLTLFDKSSFKLKPYLLGLLGFGIIVSHYATAILFVVLLCGYAIVSRKKLVVALVALFAVVGVVWYKSQNGGVAANDMFGAIRVVLSSLVSIFGAREGIAVRLFTQGVSYLPLPTLMLYIVSQILVVAGFVLILWRWFVKKDREMKGGYLVLAFVLLVLLGMEIIPSFSNFVGIDRIYLDCMIVLSPFMMIAIARVIKKWVLVATVFIALFFLMNTGFIYQVIGKPLSNAVSLNTNSYDYPMFTTKELDGAKWLLSYNDAPIYSDNVSQFAFYYFDMSVNDVFRVWDNKLAFGYTEGQYIVVNTIPQGSFIYLRDFNIEQDELTMHNSTLGIQDTRQFEIDSLGDFASVIRTAKTVYANSDCEIVQTTIRYEP